MKRITCVLVFIILIANILTAQNHLPTFKSLSVSPHTVKNDESIEIKINAYDSISRIKILAVSIYDPRNQYVEQVVGGYLEYMGNNIYAMKYHISKWAESGVYKLKEIVLINNADGILYNSTAIDSFTVVSSTPDITPPTISNVQVTPTTLNISDMVTCEFEARDDVSGLRFIWVYLRDPVNQVAVMNIHYFTSIKPLGNNRYQVKEMIPASAIKGNWQLELVIYDFADNGFRYVVNTKIFVNGIYKDYTAPTIKSVKVFPGTITSSDTLHVIVEAVDTESGINLSKGNAISAELFNEVGNSWLTGYSFKTTGQNKYLLTIPYKLFPEFIKNENLFVRVRSFDNDNNGTRYDDATKVFIPYQLLLSTNSVTFPKEGGTKLVYCSGPYDWSLSSNANWLTFERNKDELIITAKTNQTDSARYTNAIVSRAGQADQIIQVSQGIYPNSTHDIACSSVSIFPNPVSKILYLNGLTGMTTVCVFDLKGKIVIKPQIPRDRLDVSDLENGIYLIKFSDNKGEFITKFIKQ